MSQAPGWYSDPFFREQERYWDGRVWTQGTRPEGGPAEAADVQPRGAETAATWLDGPAAVESADEAPTFAPLGAPTPPVVAAPAVPPGGWAPPATSSVPGRRNNQRRLAVLGLGAAALVLVAGGVAAALVLGQPSNASASEAVTTAATQTINAQSSDMSMTMDMSVLGMHESVTANGAFDFAHYTGNMSINVNVGGKQLTEQAIYDGSTMYVNILGALGGVPSGKQWVSVDLGQLESATNGLGNMSTFGDPATMLQQLQSAGGTVTSLGPTTYEGSSVTEYSVTIPPSVLQGEMGHLPASLQQGMSGLTLPDVTADVYISPDHLLKAIYMPMSFSVGGQSMTVDMTMSFSNYGTPVTVTPPPAAEVEPLSQLGGALGGNTGTTGNTGMTGSSGNSGNTGAFL